MARRGGHRSKQPPGKDATRGIPGWIWLSGGLLLGAVLAVALFFQDQPTNKSPAKTASKTARAAPGDQPTKTTDQDDGFLFDVFEFLGSDSQPTPPPPRLTPLPTVADTPTAKPSTKASPTGGTRYWLQAGAFRDPDQADELKARLLLSGLPVRVVSGRSSQQQLWHRVRIGPYRSEADLKKPRGRLQQQKIPAIIVKTQG